MTRAGEEPGDRKLSSGRSIIVVSDLHLGLEGSDTVGRAFADFLDFIATLKPRGNGSTPPAIAAEGTIRPLYEPEKIILLGDIVDLWSPRESGGRKGRANVFGDSFLPFRKLLALPGRKIYVTGNHDTEINEVEGIFPENDRPEIEVVKRHYPEGIMADGKETFPGLAAGKHRYHFLHGQQFDILFFCSSVMRDYPGWVANNAEVFRENPGLKWAFRGVFLATLLYLIANFYGIALTGAGNAALHVLFGISLVVCVFSLDTGTFRKFWDLATQKTPSKMETVWAIVENGFWKLEEGQNITADVVVFGHTHQADDSRDVFSHRKDIGNKRFINTGAWEFSPKDGRGSYTFLYIDQDGPLLCRWVWDPGMAHGRPEYFGSTVSGDPASLQRQIAETKGALFGIRIWFRKHLSGSG